MFSHRYKIDPLFLIQEMKYIYNKVHEITENDEAGTCVIIEKKVIIILTSI